MLDLNTPKGRLIDAALRLAASRKWSEITLLDIAGAAGLSLDEVRKVAGSKSQIVAAFMRAIDDQVLVKARARPGDRQPVDALFDVIMSRFDALMPYKAALKSIRAAGPSDTTLVMPYLNSQRWMLAAAGINADGPSGLARSAGLGALYASVMSTWLDDDDPGMAKTMAALDRQLKSGHRRLAAVEEAVAMPLRFAREFPRVLCSVAKGARRPSAGEASEPPKPV